MPLTPLHLDRAGVQARLPAVTDAGEPARRALIVCSGAVDAGAAVVRVRRAATLYGTPAPYSVDHAAPLVPGTAIEIDCSGSAALVIDVVTPSATADARADLDIYLSAHELAEPEPGTRVTVGEANPSVASAGDRLYRLDHGMWYTYTGSKWLSDATVAISVARSIATAATINLIVETNVIIAGTSDAVPLPWDTCTIVGLAARSQTQMTAANTWALQALNRVGPTVLAALTVSAATQGGYAANAAYDVDIDAGTGGQALQMRAVPGVSISNPVGLVSIKRRAV